ncbi:hypothetical protein [Micromonospora foliorum]|uniref:hypothetical protein n=1 Tax=Micromonospora foliorum TaxID=2911210 RepID=UPI001EE7B112|nr:hypothetical protein [Micromonospora foliorum]MCG5437737.1 hypothetical protein [Micromonospora foliorum]
MSEQSPAITMHIYCRVDVIVTDPSAVTGHAVADLRAAHIDWSTEEDDVDTAAEELGADLTASLASLADISRLVDDIPGVEFRGGHCWAERGPARDPFHADER